MESNYEQQDIYENVIVHAYDWVIRDKYGSMNDDDGGNLSIHCWGLDRESNPCLLRFTDFPAFCQIELPLKDGRDRDIHWHEAEARKFMKNLSKTLGKHAPFKYTFGRRKKTYYYMGNRRWPIITAQFHTLESMYKCVGLLKNPIKTERWGHVFFRTYEETITVIRKLLTAKDVRYAQWFSTKCRLITDTDYKISTLKREYHADWRTMEAIPSEICKNWISKPGVLAFDIECYSNNHRAMPDKYNALHTAYMISCIYQRYQTLDTRRRYGIIIGDCNHIPPEKFENCEIIKVDSELEMIQAFADVINETDPEIVTGYNILSFDYPYLEFRIKRRNRDWPVMGRIIGEKSYMTTKNWKSGAYGYQSINMLNMEGRISIDLLPLIKRDYKLDKYDLNTVCKRFDIGKKNDVTAPEMFLIYEDIRNTLTVLVKYLKQEIEHPETVDAEFTIAKAEAEHEYQQAVIKTTQVMEYCIQDSELVIDLFEKINIWIGLVELSSIVGTTIVELFTRGQQIRCMSQLYHLAAKEAFVLDTRCAPGYTFSGGFVFEPIPGLYENIICLDFASLYPSIIMAYNICYTTLVPPELMDIVPDEDCHVIEFDQEEELNRNPNRPTSNIPEDVEIDMEADDDKEIIVETGKRKKKIKPVMVIRHYKFKFYKKIDGLLPRLVKQLVGERRAVQAILKNEKNPVLKFAYNARQLALKVSANSFFGFLGVQNGGKMPLIEAAMTITAKGRELIGKVQNYIYNEYAGIASYGDTDSFSSITPLLIHDDHGQIDIVQAKDLVKPNDPAWMSKEDFWKNYNPDPVSTTKASSTSISTTKTGRVSKATSSNSTTKPSGTSNTIAIEPTSTRGSRSRTSRSSNSCDIASCSNDNTIPQSCSSETPDTSQFSGSTQQYMDIRDKNYNIWSEKGWTQIKYIMRHKTGKQMYRINTHTGVIDVTEDHSLLDIKGDPVTPNEVKIGSELLHHDLPNVVNEHQNVIIDADTAWLYGFFYAEGTCGTYQYKKGPRSSWSISNQDLAPMNKALEILQRIEPNYKFKIDNCMKSSACHKLSARNGSTSKNCPREYHVSSLVEKYHNMFHADSGQQRHNIKSNSYTALYYKKVPKEILNASNDIKKSFYDGYYVGDGLKATTANEVFDNKGQIGAAGLYYIASALGYDVSLYLREDKPQIFRCTLSKDTKCVKSVQRKNRNAIKKIIPLGTCDDYVYDIETENHHFAAGIGRMVVHNSVMVDMNITDRSKCNYWGERLAQEISGVKKGDPLPGAEDPSEVHLEDKEGLFPPPLRMEFEKAMRLLCLKKKKYAAFLIDKRGDFKKIPIRDADGRIIAYTDKLDMLKKGIVLARRDNSIFLRETYTKILDIIMNRRSLEEALITLFDCIQDLLDDKVPVEKLAIIRELNSGYASDTFFMKVFADELRKAGKIVNPGDRLDFIITVDPNARLIGQRMKLLEQYYENLNTENAYKVDYIYYLTNALKNPINQLFEVGYKKEMEQLTDFYYKPLGKNGRPNKRIKPIYLTAPMTLITKMIEKGVNLSMIKAAIQHRMKNGPAPPVPEQPVPVVEPKKRTPRRKNNVIVGDKNIVVGEHKNMIDGSGVAATSGCHNVSSINNDISSVGAEVNMDVCNNSTSQSSNVKDISLVSDDHHQPTTKKKIVRKNTMTNKISTANGEIVVEQVDATVVPKKRASRNSNKTASKTTNKTTDKTPNVNLIRPVIASTPTPTRLSTTPSRLSPTTPTRSTATPSRTTATPSRSMSTSPTSSSQAETLIRPTAHRAKILIDNTPQATIDKPVAIINIDSILKSYQELSDSSRELVARQHINVANS